MISKILVQMENGVPVRNCLVTLVFRGLAGPAAYTDADGWAVVPHRAYGLCDVYVKNEKQAELFAPGITVVKIIAQ